MAVTTAPLLSFGASGQVAKSMVYSTWRGVPYVRRHVIPANPNTVGQQSTRSVFTFLSNMWKNAPALVQAPWTLFCSGQAFYNRNAFIGQNVRALRAGSSMAALIGSPGAKGGMAPTAIAATGGVGSISVAFTNPVAPTGWVLAEAVAMAVKAGDPHTAVTWDSFAAHVTSVFATVVIPTLAAGTYEVSAWLKWTKPDGTPAYSVGVNATATVT